jgi:hypothetical protein
MRARAFVIARAIAIVTATVLAGPERAQQCLNAQNQKCVLEQALLAAHSIKDDGTRAQALGTSPQMRT